MKPGENGWGSEKHGGWKRLERLNYFTIISEFVEVFLPTIPLPSPVLRTQGLPSFPTPPPFPRSPIPDLWGQGSPLVV